MEKDDTIYEHDDKIAVFRRVAQACQRRWRSWKATTTKRRKIFPKRLLVTSANNGKEFKDAPGDICSSITIASKNKTRKIRNQKRTSDDDEMDNNVAIAKTAGLLEGALLLELGNAFKWCV